MRQTRAEISLTTITIILIAFAMTGCIVFPMRASTRVHGSRCSENEARLPKEAPVLGLTTRQEVDEGYRCFAVETGMPGLFWGRFRKSDWMIIFAAGGYGTGAVGGSRVWGIDNLLISFNADGTVKTVEAIDDAHLLERLRVLLKEQGTPPLDLTQPARVLGFHSRQHSILSLDLNASEVVVTLWPESYAGKTPKPPARRATVPVAQISKVAFGRGGSKDLKVGVEFRLFGKTDVGEQVAFKTEAAVALLLARWLEQVNPEKQ